MSLATIRTKIKTLLESISSVGTVYDYKRYAKDWATYKTLFTEDDKVNTWEIQRDSGSAWAEATNQVNRRRHVFTIRGFYAVSDSGSSEKTIDNMLEDIIDKLRGYADLDATAERVSFDPNDPMTWTTTYNYLGPVLCHVVEIYFMVQEYTTF